MGFPGGSDGKVSAHNVGDPGSVPGGSTFLFFTVCFSYEYNGKLRIMIQMFNDSPHYLNKHKVVYGVISIGFRCLSHDHRLVAISLE